MKIILGWSNLLHHDQNFIKILRNIVIWFPSVYSYIQLTLTRIYCGLFQNLSVTIFVTGKSNYENSAFQNNVSVCTWRLAIFHSRIASTYYRCTSCWLSRPPLTLPLLYYSHSRHELLDCRCRDWQTPAVLRAASGCTITVCVAGVESRRRRKYFIIWRCALCPRAECYGRALVHAWNEVGEASLNVKKQTNINSESCQLPNRAWPHARAKEW